MGLVAYRLGLTGGIGSGKSTVSCLLEQMGAAVIDADGISRATTAPGGSAIAALKVAFGEALISKEGALDRSKMRALIYSDPTAKTTLESVIHPLVGQEIVLQARRAQSSGASCIVFDIPLLVESQHWRMRLDRVLVIDCTEQTQVARVMERNGLAEQEVRNILSAQASRKQRRAAADLVLFNDNISLDNLRLQVREIGAQFGL